MSARMRLTRIMAKMGPRKPKPVQTQTKWNIVRGDKVQVIGDHSEAGKQGIVMQVMRKEGRVLVEGINVGPKHIKGNPEKGVTGRTLKIEKSVPYAAVNLVDPVTNQPTRVARKILEDGSKVRVAKKSGAIIPRPERLQFRKRPWNHIVTESDTLEEDVWEETYEVYG